jgi:hypothetical protein
VIPETLAVTASSLRSVRASPGNVGASTDDVGTSTECPVVPASLSS